MIANRSTKEQNPQFGKSTVCMEACFVQKQRIGSMHIFCRKIQLWKSKTRMHRNDARRTKIDIRLRTAFSPSVSNQNAKSMIRKYSYLPTRVFRCSSLTFSVFRILMMVQDFSLTRSTWRVLTRLLEDQWLRAARPGSPGTCQAVPPAS